MRVQLLYVVFVSKSYVLSVTWIPIDRTPIDLNWSLLYERLRRSNSLSEMVWEIVVTKPSWYKADKKNLCLLLPHLYILYMIINGFKEVGASIVIIKINALNMSTKTKHYVCVIN